MDTLLIGDIHGEWNYLKKVIKHYDLRDCILICVGDLGIGFAANEAKEIRIHIDLNEFFKGRNIFFKSIRGNHDDPKWFRSKPDSLTNFELLPDFTVMQVNGEKWFFVGGAISIDRRLRVPGTSWWENEGFPKNWREKINVGNIDVLVTHSAPHWSGPTVKNGIVIHFAEKDPTLLEECNKERTEIQSMIDILRPRAHYAGHFHLHSISTRNGCTSRILDINEVYHHRPC